MVTLDNFVDHLNVICEDFQKRSGPLYENEKKHIYMIIMKDTNLFKIGISKNIKSRLLSLQCGNPVELVVLYKTIQMYRARQIEQLLHKSLNEFKVMNEWFELPPSIQEKLKEAFVETLCD